MQVGNILFKAIQITVNDSWKGGFAGYAGGGFTGEGNKYDIAGPVHKGEFVFNKEATKRIEMQSLQQMRGYADGGYVGGAIYRNKVRNWWRVNRRQQQL